MIPCPAASSYPVVPLIWPAKNKFDINLLSKVFFNWFGYKKSYSIAYPGLVIEIASNPLIVFKKLSWTSCGKEVDSPFGNH